jgi:hypothetical protein
MKNIYTIFIQKLALFTQKVKGKHSECGIHPALARGTRKRWVQAECGLRSENHPLPHSAMRKPHQLV